MEILYYSLPALLYFPGPVQNEMIFMTTSTLRNKPKKSFLATLDFILSWYGDVKQCQSSFSKIIVIPFDRSMSVGSRKNVQWSIWMNQEWNYIEMR